MELIVASGDTAEGFEFGEAIFDAVAITIQMLVKRRYLPSIGLQAYDDGAAELVHICGLSARCLGTYAMKKP